MTVMPVPGAVYDVGSALALYWPDVHPCGAVRVESWLVFTPDGGADWRDEITVGARFLGMIPGVSA